MVLVLSEAEVSRLLRIDDAIEAVEEALKMRALGKAWAPAKARFDLPETGGYMRVLPGALPVYGVAAIKSYLDPMGKGSGGSVLLQLYDLQRGKLIALMSAERLGQLRTAASCAVAAKYLARTDARILGVFGSGNQAGAHLEGMCRVRQISKAKVFSPNRQHREDFAERMSISLGIDVESKDSPDEVVRQTDIVVAATTARQPVFRGELLEEGVLVTSIGSHLPSIREVDDATVSRSKLVVDSLEQALENVGNLVIPMKMGLISPDQIYELGDIILGRRPGRTGDSENILYHCTGLSIYDVATSYKVWKLAEGKQVGTVVEIE